MILLYVAAGGAMGSMARYLLSHWLTRLLGGAFPYGILAVNVLGALLMGLLLGVLTQMAPRGRELHALLGIGALGGFTTFSAFTLDAYLLLERGQVGLAFLYMFLSVTLSLAGLVAGMWLFRLFFA